jgi:hypothetical protein
MLAFKYSSGHGNLLLKQEYASTKSALQRDFLADASE